MHICRSDGILRFTQARTDRACVKRRGYARTEQLRTRAQQFDRTACIAVEKQ